MANLGQRHDRLMGTTHTVVCHLIILLVARCITVATSAGLVFGHSRREGFLRRTKVIGAPSRHGAARQPSDSTSDFNESASQTVSEAYWSRAHRASPSKRQRAGRAVEATPEPAPWKKIYTASTDYQVLDTPGAHRRMVDWEFSQMGGQTKEIRKMSVVPYDMALGARIMYGLSEKNTETPPPTQDFVDEAFLSQCPMIAVGNRLSIRAPRCGSNMGEWLDGKTKQPVLWWADGSKGGIHFGVDSAVTGSGSVTFADFTTRFSQSKYLFGLQNCMRTDRYSVEEDIIKMDHMAPHASSTAEDHDMLVSRVAYFYKYSIKNPNGTTVAETTLFRLDQDEITFNYVTEDSLEAAPIPIAIARRQGKWRRDQWRECTRTLRGWQVYFPNASSDDLLVTIKDLRIATAAVLTLLAVRDESVTNDGFPRMGQGYLVWLVWRTIIWVIVGLVLAGICFLCLIVQGNDKKLKRWLFRLESLMLPKYPLIQRSPNFHATH